jgi:hypothetical protein
VHGSAEFCCTVVRLPVTATVRIVFLLLLAMFVLPRSYAAD